MDLIRAVRYRGFDLNTIRHDTLTRDMVGCEVTRVAYHGVMGVGYDEKKALADGHDAGDVFLGKRGIEMRGNLYGRTRAELFDLMVDFMEVLTPTAAYGQDPGNKGFLPLDFYLPTERTEMPWPKNDDGSYQISPWDGARSKEGPFPSGLRHVFLLARPLAQPAVEWVSDAQGGQDDQALSIPWSAVLEARMPNMLSYDWTTVSMAGAASGSGSIYNRGTRPATIQWRMVVPPRFNGTAQGRVGLASGGMGANMSILIPSTDAQQIIDYDSYHKVVALNGVLRMDLLAFNAGYGHPQVKPGGPHTYLWTRTGTKNLLAGSYFRFRDTWA